MSDDIQHRARIAIAEIKAGGSIPCATKTLLDLIEMLEQKADEDALEIAAARHVSELAQSAVDYHLSGKFDHPRHNELWDANEMLSLMDDLAEALNP